MDKTKSKNTYFFITPKNHLLDVSLFKVMVRTIGAYIHWEEEYKALPGSLTAQFISNKMVLMGIGDVYSPAPSTHGYVGKPTMSVFLFFR